MTKHRKTRMSGKREHLFELCCEVSKLSSEKRTIAQICRATGLDRKTVKKYQRFGCREEAWAYFTGSHSRASPKREELAHFVDFFISELTDDAGLSKAQILDHFQETYPDAAPATKSTLNRFLDYLIEEYGIEKAPKYCRDFRRHDPEGWGKEAEVDFGEMVLFDAERCSHKVFFILVVLKASCYKFLYLMEKKFDALHAAYGLHLAFSYFEGVPERVIFDQDRVFINDDNHGDFKTTQALEEYVRNAGFTPDFCHPYDPQSKGRVEKYVDFVKKNFLRGRRFTDIRRLNEQALSWLNRTGNKKVHDIYLRTPKDMFINDEKPHLKPYSHYMEDPDREATLRTVHKDNTVRYEGSICDVPPRTFNSEFFLIL